MTRVRTLVLASLGCASLMGACRSAEEAATDDFRNGVPRQETVQMNVPGAASGAQALSVETKSEPLQGQTSDFYRLTRDVSALVNGGGALVLALVKTIVSYPPTTVSADMAVWGPWKGGPLDPLTYRVTVTRAGAHTFSYVIAAHDKTDDNAAFVTILSGTHTPALDGSGAALEGYGSGDFTLDWDARATLPAPGNDVGKASYTYLRQSATATVTVDAHFKQVKDDGNPGQRVDVDYLYAATPGAGGSLEFAHDGLAGSSHASARLTVKSRWAETGAGRSDVHATGGDIPAGTTLSASECWDIHFASAFLSASWAAGAGYGTESTDCVFTPAEYSSL